MRILTSIALLALCYSISTARRVKRGYTDSFTFATFRNTQSGQEKTVCANYLQFRKDYLPVTPKDAVALRLRWWKDNAGQTKICPLPSSTDPPKNYSGSVVPLDYRIDDDGTNCTRHFNTNSSSFRFAAQFQVTEVQNDGASSVLFLLDKGRQFVTRWRDYLFSDFYDPFVNVSTAVPTFFIYSDVLKDTLKELDDHDAESIDVLFHRPMDETFDLSMLIIWLLAMGCVAGGGIWAFVRHRVGKDKPTLRVATSPATRSAEDSSESTESHTASWCATHANCCAIVTLMVFLVGILMIGFFFRPVLVTLFNVLLMIFGSFSVYGCVRALLSNFTCFYNCACFKKEVPLPHRFVEEGQRPTYVDVVLYLLSLTFCIVWYVYRKTSYAFILLDIINVTLCLHILKSLRLPSLKWISTLMLCMFIYDAFMVFVTPLWTKNGCSVMLEVATGIDCSTSNSVGYPMPPIDANLPEKFPMLMQVMHFDPMMECFDLEVERGFQMTILGLGDIIIPGYLVTHCFTMNGFSEKTRIMYGTICIIGYGIGLIVTFVALTLMSMAQPALIYLVPCTLFPVMGTAAIRKEFSRVWNGVSDEEAKPTVSDASTVQLSISSSSDNSLPVAV